MLRCAATLALLIGCTLARAQTQPSFEVVSIKTAPQPTMAAVRGGTARVGYDISGDRVEFVGYRLDVLIARAFGVERAQVDLRGLGGDYYFEVQAKLPPGATPAQVPEMLQTMLADRFHLAYHREPREYHITVLAVGKSGFKLPRLPDDTRESDAIVGGRLTLVGPLKSLLPVLQSFGGLGQIIDETGLEGSYKWVLEPPSRQSLDPMRDAYVNMLEDAGLKIEGRKVIRDTIVVDRLEPLPTEN